LIRYDKAKLKFQISDPDAYYVHHMSMFEHVLHKAYGFEVAKNKTLIMSRAAFHGECDNLIAFPEEKFVALIPFYGGLPPNVTKDLSVKSIGQGNSLVSCCKHYFSVSTFCLQVDASTKALQTMATLCSCLKYYGKAIIGVTRLEDKNLILHLVRSYFYYLTCFIGLNFHSFLSRFLRFRP
jgi:hypothetical protein